MKYLIILTLLIFSCGEKTKDPVDKFDRFDLGNTLDTTGGTYNPKFDSAYIFPTDSVDIISETEYSDYKIKTIIFPIRNKYVVAFKEYVDKTPKIRLNKIRYREYKLQVEITDHEGLYIKKVLSKYDFPDSILTKPDNYFIRDVKFKGLKNDEFRLDVKVSFYDETKPTAMIKYYIHLVDKIRFEDYPQTYYDSLNPGPNGN